MALACASLHAKVFKPFEGVAWSLDTEQAEQGAVCKTAEGNARALSAGCSSRKGVGLGEKVESTGQQLETLSEDCEEQY